MVQWKGDISEEDSGGRAARLDSVDGLQVPNFFVITREEVQNLVEDQTDPDAVIQKELQEEQYSQVKEAYSDINVSSEVRNASGRARNLVEGQRNGGKVSVRVSGERKGVYNYRINVGASGLEDAIKHVAASYYAVENKHEHPAIIVQRMIESEISGAVINSYHGHTLVEAVKGMGTSLEEGLTTPDTYLLKDGSVVESRFPDEQIKTTINPMSGSQRKKTEKRRKTLFENLEIEKLSEKAGQEGLNVKFAYKRGSFYVVDAFEPDNSNPFNSSTPSLNGIRVSDGEIDGQVGREIQLSDETLPPGQYTEALIARKGGYTSTHAQMARQNSKPAVFSYQGQLQEGQHVHIEARSSTPEETEENLERQERTPEQRPTGSPANLDELTALEVMPINARNGIYISPPFRGRYAVTDQEIPGGIPTSGYLKSYADIFRFRGDRALIDARRLERDGLKNAMEYIEADTLLLVTDRLNREIIQTAVKEGFDGIGVPKDVEQVREAVAREERRFILEKLRELG